MLTCFFPRVLGREASTIITFLEEGVSTRLGTRGLVAAAVCGLLLGGAAGAAAQTADVRIDSVSPASAPVTRHTEVEIRGTGFTPEMKVAFGPMWAWKTEFVSQGTLRVVTPVSLRPGPVSIVFRLGGRNFAPGGNTSFVFEPDATYKAILEARRAKAEADWETAERIYRGVLAAGVPDRDMRAFVMTELAWLLISRGQLEEAEQTAREAQKLFYHYGSTHAALGMALYWQGKLQEAWQLVKFAGGKAKDQGRTVEYGRLVAMFTYSWEEFVGGKESRGLDSFLHDAKESAPEDPLVLLLSGIVNCRRGGLDQGMQQLKEALPKINVSSGGFSRGFAYAVLGEAYSLRNASGDRARARQHWQEAGRMDPTLARKYFNVGLGHLRMGHWKRGRSYLVQALVMAPRGTFAKRAREILQQTQSYEE